MDASDVDDTVFERLAEDFEGVSREFGQFVEEKAAVVGEADLAGTRDRAAPDECGGRNGVVRGTKGARVDERTIGGEQTGDRVEFGRRKRFFDGHRREDRGETPCHHRFTASRRTEQDQVMSARGRDFEGAFDGSVPFDVLEIELEAGRFDRQKRGVVGHGQQRIGERERTGEFG